MTGMQRTITVATAAGVGRQVILSGFPDRCPRCHSNVAPKPLVATARTTEATEDLEEAFHCTNSKCGRLFLAIFRYNSPSGRYTYYRSIPVEPVKPAVSDLVVSLSPTFYETYSQAMAAEGFGLTQLTGIGLRKALEFLVKDFAIAEQPEEAEAIRKKQLAACIKDYIADANVKETARRAAWLGNDETHYVRKWEDRDIEDLKILIRLTVNGIENVLLSRKYIAEMPE
jgi:hypothetical protein